MKRACCLLLALLLSLTSMVSLAHGETAVIGEQDGSALAEGEKTGDPEEGEGAAGFYGDLPVTGACVWQVRDRAIHCVDAGTQQEAAQMPLSELYAEREDYLSLTRQGEGVMLCAVFGANSADSRVHLYRLELRDGGIQLAGSEDVTDVLGPMFNGETAWQEVDMIGCAGGLFIAALNPDLVFQLYLFNPQTKELKRLGERDLSGYSAVVPYGEDLLLIGASENALEAEELIRISLADGAFSELGILSTGTFTQVMGCAVDAESRTLYYSLEGVGYRVKLDGDLTPEAFCLLPQEASPLRYGAVAAGRYVFLDEQGNLLFRDAAATLTAEKLRILDLTGSEAVKETVSAFNRTTPEYLASVTMGDQPKDILEAVLNQSPDYDAYVINLGSDLYKSLYSRGYLGSLSGSGALDAAAAAFPEGIRSRIQADGGLVAFPTGVMNSVFVLNTAGISELTGLSREEIPTDWPGFLRLVRQMGEDGSLENGRWVLYDAGVSAETFRVILTTWILRDALLWLNQDPGRLGRLQMALTPALQALDEIDLVRLGFSETEGEDASWRISDEAMPLLEETEAQISVMNMPEGGEYWPLALAEGEERLAPQDVGVIVLNPFSAKGEGVRKFVETLWAEMDPITRMELDADSREPVKNESFNEDISYLESLVPMYEEAIAAAETEAEKAEMQAELNQMKAFLESYQKNAAWLISEDSIALYSQLEPWLALHGDEFWNEETGGSILMQYLDGMLGADQFVYQLVLSLQMAQMESE